MSFDDVIAIIKDEKLPSSSIKQIIKKDSNIINEIPMISKVGNKTKELKTSLINTNNLNIHEINTRIKTSKVEEIHKNEISFEEDNNLPMIPGAPMDGRIAFVSCSTTEGNIKLAIHEAWAPLGANRFLDLVESNFFSTQV